MRKFTSLMLMLLCAVTTAWAGPTDLPQITTDLDNPIYYTISNTRSTSGKLLYYTADGVKDATPQVLTDAYKFFFTGSSLSDIKIHNAAAKTESGELLFTGAGAWNETGVSCEICVTPHESNAGLAIKFSGTSLNEQNFANGYTTYNANDAGSIFVMDLVEDINWPEVDKFYTIEAPLFENVKGVKKGLVVNEDGSLGWNTIDITNKNHYWTVQYDAEKDGYAVMNLGTNKYLNGTEMSDAIANYAKFNYLTQCQFNIVVNGTTMHANNHGGGANASGNIVSWGGSLGSASAWKFVKRQNPDATTEIEITYNFTYNGQALEGYTQTVKTLVGEEYPNITVSFPFGVSATKPAGTIAADAETTVTIAVEENLPFVYAASYEAITKWYYIQQHSSGGSYSRYIQYAKENDKTYIEWVDVDMTAGEENTYSWAFIGDPFKGFKMVNLGAPADANAVVSNGSGNPSFGALADATAWNIKASRTNNDAEHFCLQYPGSNQYMNAQSGKIAFWGDNDQGSTMWVTDIDEAKAAIVEEFKNNALAGLGYVGGYALDLKDEIEAIATLDDINAFENANTTIAFEAGAYYRIQNVYRTTYATISGTDRVLAELNNGSAAQLWQVEAGTAEKTYSIKNVNAAAYMQVPGNNVLGEKADLKINNLKEGIGQFCIQDPANGNQLAGINATTFGVWWNAAVGSDLAYRFIPVTELEVSINEFASVCLPFAVEVEGAKAYAVESVETGFVTLAEKADIPAGEGAILAGKGTATLTIADAATSVWTNNKLEGTTVDSYIAPAGTAYVLGKLDGEVGLYKAKLNKKEDGTAAAEGEAGTHFLNNANKAYLVVANANPAAQYSFRFGEGTTGIENIESAEAVKAIFDLTGRRVEAITAPGIYIVNGKKVLVK